MEVDSYNTYLNVGLVLLVTLLVAKLITALTTPKTRGKRLPPVVDALPVVGGLLRFIKGPVKMLHEEYPKLGSVMTVNLLHKKMTFLLGPEVSEHFFNAPESDLSQREVYKYNVPTFGPGVVYDVDYPIRVQQFNFFAEALRGLKLSYVEHMVSEAQDYFSKWGNSGVVDLKHEMQQLIMLTASRSLLGEEVRYHLFDEVSDLLNDLDNGMRPISLILPYLPIPAHLRRDRSRKKLADIFANIMASRRQSGDIKNDMLQSLMDSKYKDGRKTTDSEVTGMLIALLFGGRQSSSVASIWTGAYLISNKKYLEAALEEQKMIMKKYGDRVDHEVLSEMVVLHRCVKEAMRLHPPLIILLRLSHRDFSVTTRDGKEYDIPKGHIIATSPAFANRLPHIYKDPDTYDPDRFSLGRDEGKVTGPLSYLSLGGGRHGCLGEAFVYLELKAIWSHMLRNFEMELISPFPEIDWNTIIVGVKGDVTMRYKYRKLPVE